MKNQQYFHLMIIEPTFENIYTNHSHFAIKEEDGLQSYTHFIECDICGILINHDKTIVIKYGTGKYMRCIF